VSALGDLLRKLAVKVDKAIEDAGGDPIEALHGHRCGPDCWHKQGLWIGSKPPCWHALTEDQCSHAFPSLLETGLGWTGDLYSACKMAQIRTQPTFIFDGKIGRCPYCLKALQEMGITP
jgi:hypothetical protein